MPLKFGTNIIWSVGVQKVLRAKLNARQRVKMNREVYELTDVKKSMQNCVLVCVVQRRKITV